jgi:hypothetical protein
LIEDAVCSFGQATNLSLGEKCLMAWKAVYMPKELGGLLGIIDLRRLGITLEWNGCATYRLSANR